jgi:threonyl-tRNA synthetase
MAIRGVENVSQTPLAGGNFGDIFRGEYQGGLVALKRLRLFQTESEESIQIHRVGSFWLVED